MNNMMRLGSGSVMVLAIVRAPVSSRRQYSASRLVSVASADMGALTPPQSQVPVQGETRVHGCGSKPMANSEKIEFLFAEGDRRPLAPPCIRSAPSLVNAGNR